MRIIHESPLQQILVENTHALQIHFLEPVT